jgi:hypothetical protein
MVAIFIEGFDKYGAVNLAGGAINPYLSGDWTTVSGSGSQLVGGLSATGYALQLAVNTTLSRTFAANYGRLIGGMRFSANLASNPCGGIQFNDASGNQCGIGVNNTGTISLRNGSWSSGTVLGTSTVSVAANSTHYLEWDITFSATGAYQLWLDGISIISGTGNTKTTVNNYCNVFQPISGTTIGNSFIIDDLYLFDNTGTQNNAALLSSPRVETEFPSADAAVQFGFGAAAVGYFGVPRNAGFYGGGGTNSLYVVPVVPTRAGTLNSISFTPGASNGAVNLRPVVYADSGGNPGALLVTGSTVTGVTNGVITTLPLTTPQALTAGTRYWLGTIQDILVTNLYQIYDGSNVGRWVGNTFSAGPPATFPTTGVSVGQNTIQYWGNVTGTGVNFYEVNQNNPPPGALSYVFDTVVGHEDLYAMPSLSATPAAIYAVAVKAYCAKSDSGARTVSMRMLSGATDSGGSLTGQTPATTYGWMASYFPTDPNTGAAWTVTALNAAQCGFRIDS